MPMISILEKDEPRARTPRARGTAASRSSASEPATDVPELPSRTYDREVVAEHEDEDEGRQEREGDDTAEHPVDAPPFLDEVGDERKRSKKHDARHAVYDTSETEHCRHHCAPGVEDTVDVREHPGTFLTSVERRNCHSATDRHGLPPSFWFGNVPMSRTVHFLGRIERSILCSTSQWQQKIRSIAVYNFLALRIKKFSSPKIKIWFEPMFFSGFFCGFERCGSAAFPNFRGGNSSPPAAAKCVRTNSRILHHVGKVKEFWFASLRSATNLYWILGVKKNSRFRILGEENFLILNPTRI